MVMKETGLYEDKRTENGRLLPIYCGTQYNDGIGIVNAHYHEYIEILYVIEGENEIWLNGEYYQFKKGDMVLINSKEVHLIRCGFGCYIVVQFMPDLLFSSYQEQSDFQYVLPFLLETAKHQKIFTAEELEGSRVKELLYSLNEEMDKKRYGYEMAAKILINQIFLWVLRYWNDKGASVSLELAQPVMDRLQIVFDYVSEHYAEPITAEEAAGLCNMSYSYFSRFFKKSMKKSFSEYLNYIRINEAEKLLITTDLNVTEVAMQTGFSTSSYFIQQFKRVKSISPKQFRKNFM